MPKRKKTTTVSSTASTADSKTALQARLAQLKDRRLGTAQRQAREILDLNPTMARQQRRMQGSSTLIVEQHKAQQRGDTMPSEQGLDNLMALNSAFEQLQSFKTASPQATVEAQPEQPTSQSGPLRPAIEPLALDEIL